MLRFIALSALLVAFVSGGKNMENRLQQPKIGSIEEIYKSDTMSLTDLKDCKSVDPKNVIFRLYTREQPNLGKTINLKDHGVSLKNSTYNVRKPTKFLIHGWIQQEPVMGQMVADYLITKDVNVITIDWQEYSTSCSYHSTRDVVVYGVADAVAMLLKKLVVRGSNSGEDFHMIAFGVAAHIAGQAAKNFYPNRIARISALDPTAFHYGTPSLYRLSNGDAHFVDVLYTSIPFVAVDKEVSHASFYPNGGIHPQPNCGDEAHDIICSHLSSIYIWKKFITSPQEAYQCESYLKWKAGECKTMSTYAGEHASSDARGSYFLDITLVSPLQSIITPPLIPVQTTTLESQQVPLHN